MLAHFVLTIWEMYRCVTGLIEFEFNFIHI